MLGRQEGRGDATSLAEKSREVWNGIGWWARLKWYRIARGSGSEIGLRRDEASTRRPYVPH